MSDSIRVSDLPEFDAAKYLDSDEAIAAYLTAAIEAGEPGLLAAALGDVVRARGMTQLAADSAMACASLLREPDPSFATIVRVCGALGLRLMVKPIAQGNEHGNG
jgi:probable addiction module antidote protein